MGRGGNRSLQDPRLLRWGRSPSPHGARGVQCGTGAKGAGPEARGACGVRLFVGLGTVAPLCLAPHFPIGRAAGSSTGLGGRGGGGGASQQVPSARCVLDTLSHLDSAGRPKPSLWLADLWGAGGSPETPPEGVEEGPSHRPGTPGTCPRASAPAPEVRPGPPRAACLTAGKRSRPPPGLNLPAFHYQVAAGARSPTPARGSGLQRRD